MQKGLKVAKGAIEFDPEDDILGGFILVGFTICDDPQKGLYVLFPSSLSKNLEGQNKQYFFLRPNNPSLIEKLETKILDAYDKMMGVKSREN